MTEPPSQRNELRIPTDHPARDIVVHQSASGWAVAVEPDEAALRLTPRNDLGGNLAAVRLDERFGLSGERIVFLQPGLPTDFGQSGQIASDYLKHIATLLRSPVTGSPRFSTSPQDGEAESAQVTFLPPGTLELRIAANDLDPARPFSSLTTAMLEATAHRSRLHATASAFAESFESAAQNTVGHVEVTWISDTDTTDLRPEEADVLRCELGHIASIVRSLILTAGIAIPEPAEGIS